MTAACSLVGCMPSATGAFDDKGYHHSKYDYWVDATHPPDPAVANETLLGNDWKVDNFYRNSNSGLAPKETESYLIKYAFDVNGDGKADFYKDDFVYDLRFKNMKRDAVIWLRTMPIPDDLKDKELRVLVQRYVDEVSGADFEAVKLGPTTALVRERRFGASVVSRGRLKVAEQDAYETTFDVANVDELAINPNARRTRVRIVLVRTPFVYPVRGSHGPRHEFSVLMLAGYANLHEDFATDEKAFQLLLEHTAIDGKRGTTAVALETAPQPGAPDAEPAGAAPPLSVGPTDPAAATP